MEEVEATRTRAHQVAARQDGQGGEMEGEGRSGSGQGGVHPADNHNYLCRARS